MRAVVWSEWGVRYFGQFLGVASEGTVYHFYFFAKYAVEFGVANNFIADDYFVVFFLFVLEAVFLNVFASETLHGARE